MYYLALLALWLLIISGQQEALAGYLSPGALLAGPGLGRVSAPPLEATGPSGGTLTPKVLATAPHLPLQTGSGKFPLLIDPGASLSMLVS